MMVIARKNLWVGLMTGALLLGVINLNLTSLWQIISNTLTNSSILFMAISVGLIPVLGAILEESSLIDNLLDSIQMKSKLFIGLTPAFLGMLTMPGGALLSAPVIKKAGDDIKNVDYTAINVWYRHILVMVYPLGPLLPTTKMAGLDLYTEVLYLLPFFGLLFLLGHFFIINNISSSHEIQGKVDIKKILIPILITICAPVLHITQISLLPILSELALFISVILTLIIAFHLSNTSYSKFIPYLKKMRAWKYGLIILGMFLFLNIFKATELSSALENIHLSKTLLIVVFGGLIGFITGRTQLGISIILPIYLAKYGQAELNYLSFTLLFFSVFVGYIFSPIHPCVTVSVEYFNSSLKNLYRKIFIPIMIALGVAAVISFIIIN